MNELETKIQKGSTAFSGSTGSHGFHGSKLVYTKSTWEYWMLLGMFGVGLAAAVWIAQWVLITLAAILVLWVVGDMLSMPYDTIQITDEKISLLRKQHIYREYLFQAHDRVTLKITRHFREYMHYYRLTMRLHSEWDGRKSTVIRFKHFVNSGHHQLHEEVQEIKTFLETMANQQVEVKESFSFLQSW